ncbi:hypothetical protein CYMTET_31450 [Cymbomonas tetramitiformis]|uniref:Uncharacterized protein n=1 Tax=Cymbomonas tetramitiformis TaxID=36881 RepID=A0AAE0FH10_9CHLO|nr:hypothetical protein CYMTET_31450 [Cymbomonas tetramitiformis]
MAPRHKGSGVDPKAVKSSIMPRCLRPIEELEEAPAAEFSPEQKEAEREADSAAEVAEASLLELEEEHKIAEATEAAEALANQLELSVKKAEEKARKAKLRREQLAAEAREMTLEKIHKREAASAELEAQKRARWAQRLGQHVLFRNGVLLANCARRDVGLSSLWSLLVTTVLAAALPLGNGRYTRGELSRWTAGALCRPAELVPRRLIGDFLQRPVHPPLLQLMRCRADDVKAVRSHWTASFWQRSHSISACSCRSSLYTGRMDAHSSDPSRLLWDSQGASISQGASNLSFVVHCTIGTSLNAQSVTQGASSEPRSRRTRLSGAQDGWGEGELRRRRRQGSEKAQEVLKHHNEMKEEERLAAKQKLELKEARRLSALENANATRKQKVKASRFRAVKAIKNMMSSPGRRSSKKAEACASKQAETQRQEPVKSTWPSLEYMRSMGDLDRVDKMEFGLASPGPEAGKTSEGETNAREKHRNFILVSQFLKLKARARQSLGSRSNEGLSFRLLGRRRSV